MASKTLDCVAHNLALAALTCFKTGGLLVAAAFAYLAFMAGSNGGPVGDVLPNDHVIFVLTGFGLTAIYGIVVALLGALFFCGLANIVWAYEYRARCAGR